MFVELCSSSIHSTIRYGPPASKRLIVFIDDLNLPYIETYGTQNAIALLTQHMSYGTIFDRLDLGLRKELVDIQYMAAMNPTAVSEQPYTCIHSIKTVSAASPMISNSLALYLISMKIL